MASDYINNIKMLINFILFILCRQGSRHFKHIAVFDAYISFAR